MISIWEILDKKYEWIAIDGNGMKCAYTHQPKYAEEQEYWIYSNEVLELVETEFVDTVPLDHIINVEYPISVLTQRPE